MSIAAYQAAQAADCPVYYVNTNDGEIINLLAPDEATPLEVKITVADYLALYDLIPDDKHHPQGRPWAGIGWSIAWWRLPAACVTPGRRSTMIASTASGFCVSRQGGRLISSEFTRAWC